MAKILFSLLYGTYQFAISNLRHHLGMMIHIIYVQITCKNIGSLCDLHLNISWDAHCIVHAHFTTISWLCQPTTFQRMSDQPIIVGRCRQRERKEGLSILWFEILEIYWNINMQIDQRITIQISFKEVKTKLGFETFSHVEYVKCTWFVYRKMVCCGVVNI